MRLVFGVIITMNNAKDVVLVNRMCCGLKCMIQFNMICVHNASVCP